jgi:hypothetical protein
MNFCRLIVVVIGSMPRSSLRKRGLPRIAGSAFSAMNSNTLVGLVLKNSFGKAKEMSPRKGAQINCRFCHPQYSPRQWEGEGSTPEASN